MIPAPFDYHRPASIADALSLLQQFGDDGRVLAGGYSLVPMMKLRFAQPAHLVDIGALAELRGIREEGGELRIGALATQHEILTSPLLAKRCPILPEAAQVIADPQVRYRGTIGGNLANGDPGNDMPAVMMALDAAYVLRGPKGSRTVKANEFYLGIYTTALALGELLTEIRIAPPPGHGYAYQKMKRKVGDYATAAAAVILTLDGGRCRHAAITLTNVGSVPLKATEAERALVGHAIDTAAIAAAATAAMKIASPAADLRGSVEFRTHVTGVMVRRAIALALTRAKGA